MSSVKKILIVDDDYDFLESLQLLLINEGHDVLAITNGNSAVLKYQEFNPDIVFLDVKMPVIDGYEAFLRIIKYDHNAKVVFISSYMLDDIKYKNAKDRSLAGLINKPIKLDILRKIIKKHAK